MKNPKLTSGKGKKGCQVAFFCHRRKRSECCVSGTILRGGSCGSLLVLQNLEQRKVKSLICSVGRLKGSDQRKSNSLATTQKLKIDWITRDGCFPRNRKGCQVTSPPICVEKLRAALEEVRDGLPEISSGAGIRPMIESRHGSDLQESLKASRILGKSNAVFADRFPLIAL